jgi:hypothetical protein
MAAHDAEYFQQRRRQHGILPRDLLLAPRFLKYGAELRRLEQLPWPRNLYGENATIAELMAEAALIEQGVQTSDELCPCGCHREHKHRIADPSQTVRPWLRHHLFLVRCLQEHVEP